MKKLLSTLFFLTIISTISNAQSEPSDVKKSIFKVNLTGLTLNNYGFQFEQVLKKRLSVAFAYRTMPLGKIPFKTQIINQSTDPIATRDALDALKFGNSATTAEIRIYAGIKPQLQYLNNKPNNNPLKRNSSPKPAITRYLK